MKIFNACILFFCFGTVCLAQQTSSSELINNARKYDGQAVIYTGEAIGDVMMRGDFAWVNINDGQNAIGVWMSRELAETINLTGSYKNIGDQIEISGIFNRNCTQHGGDMDIHAQNIRIIRQGRNLSEQVDITKRNCVYILFGVLLLVLIFVRHRKTAKT